LKTDSGYPKDAGVTLFTLATPWNSLRHSTPRSALPVSTLAHSRGPGARQAEAPEPPRATRSTPEPILTIKENKFFFFGGSQHFCQIKLSSEQPILSCDWPVPTANARAVLTDQCGESGDDNLSCFEGFGENLGEMLRVTKKTQKNYYFFRLSM